MKSTTITITPLQAQKIMSIISQGGDVALRFRQSGQKGGFMGVLAGLARAAVPLAKVLGSGALTGAAAYGGNKLMEAMTGGGHCCQGPSITCTKKQMDAIRQCGSGHPIAINFKVSQSNKHRRGMLGAGMTDMIGTMMGKLPTLIGTALGKAAPKVAEAGGAAAGNYFSGKINNFMKPKESVVRQGPVVNRPRYRSSKSGGGVRLGGRGVNLAGRYTQHGEGFFDDLGDTLSSAGRQIANVGKTVGRQVKKNSQNLLRQASRVPAREFIVKNAMGLMQ